VKTVRLGEVLVNAGYINEAQLERALDIQKSSTSRKLLGDLLIELGYVSEDEILKELANQ